MVQELDPTRVWVSDVARAAVSFCVSEFGVRPFSASEDDLETFELIYAISVLTHLAADDGRRVLDLFARRLRPGGAVMFTTHGRASLARGHRRRACTGGHGQPRLADSGRTPPIDEHRPDPLRRDGRAPSP